MERREQNRYERKQRKKTLLQVNSEISGVIVDIYDTTLDTRKKTLN
jgi:hypothetical protein